MGEFCGDGKEGYATTCRYANDFHLPFCRTNLRKFSVSFQRPAYYNSLETDIKESNSLHSLKPKLKKKKKKKKKNIYVNY